MNILYKFIFLHLQFQTLIVPVSRLLSLTILLRERIFTVTLLENSCLSAFSNSWRTSLMSQSSSEKSLFWLIIKNDINNENIVYIYILFGIFHCIHAYYILLDRIQGGIDEVNFILWEAFARFTIFYFDKMWGFFNVCMLCS